MVSSRTEANSAVESIADLRAQWLKLCVVAWAFNANRRVMSSKPVLAYIARSCFLKNRGPTLKTTSVDSEIQ